jgi:hypothetical protein
MTRPLKPHKVDEVRSSNGLIELPVYFDRDKKDFFVTVGDDRDGQVRADSIPEVKRLAREAMAKMIPYKWEGFIFVEVGRTWKEENRNHKNGSQVGFSFTRMERSPHPTKPEHFVYRKHAIDFEATSNPDGPSEYARLRRERNENFEDFWVGDEVVLPYSDELWNGLLAMRAALDEAAAKLKALIEGSGLADQLRLMAKQGAPPMLPAAVVETATKTTRKNHART